MHLDLSVSTMNMPSTGGLNGGKSLFSTQAVSSPANGGSNSNNFTGTPSASNYPELPNLKVSVRPCRTRRRLISALTVLTLFGSQASNRLNSGIAVSPRSSAAGGSSGLGKEAGGTAAGNKKYRSGGSSAARQQQQQQQQQQMLLQQQQLQQQQQQQTYMMAQGQGGAQGAAPLPSGSRASRRHKYSTGGGGGGADLGASYGQGQGGPGAAVSDSAGASYGYGSLYGANGSIKSMPDMGQLLPQISGGGGASSSGTSSSSMASAAGQRSIATAFLPFPVSQLTVCVSICVCLCGQVRRPAPPSGPPRCSWRAERGRAAAGRRATR